MAIVERKTCGGCGESSLEHEKSCWACGGSRFLPPGTRLAGEPTICMDDIGTRTVMANVRRRQTPPLMPFLYLAAGLSFAFFMCTLGFWLGRASAPAPEPAPAVEAVSAPVPLPTPPAGFAGMPQNYPVSGVQAGPALSDPIVRVQTDKRQVKKPDDASATPPPTIIHTPSAAAVEPGPAQPLPVQPQPALVYVAPQRPVQNMVSRPVGPLAPAPAAAMVPPAPRADAAVVSVRNDTSEPVRVTLESGGVEQATAVVAPGSGFPFPLPGGSYQLKASGDGLMARSTLTLANRRTYSLVVSRRKEDDKETLLVTEPAIDGG